MAMALLFQISTKRLQKLDNSQTLFANPHDCSLTLQSNSTGSVGCIVCSKLWVSRYKICVYTSAAFDTTIGWLSNSNA